MTVIFGILVGLALGLTGGGGTMLAVPLLIYGLGLDAKAAVPLSLAAVAVVAGIGAAGAFRQKLVETRVALIFASTGVVAAPVGVWLGNGVSNAVIITGFAALMLVVATRMLWRTYRQPDEVGVVRASLQQTAGAADAGPVCRYSDDGVLRLNAPCSAALAVVGVVVGLLSGFFGVGGGFLIVPALLMVTQMGIHRAVATSLLVITLIGASGVLAAFVGGRGLPLVTTALFVVGGVLGMALGRRLAARVAGPILQLVFAVGVMLAGLCILISQHLLAV